MPITELESKRQFKCTWVDSRLKVRVTTLALLERNSLVNLVFGFCFYKEEKELTLYPAKTATVAELLEEARKHMTLSDSGSGKLR